MTVKSEGVCYQTRQEKCRKGKEVRFYADMDGSGGCSLKMLNEGKNERHK
jgi:hypothetical protein